MLGHYQLLEAIGRGGMGLVYRARDTRLEREVAVKCLRTELFISSHTEFEGHYIERFKREALLLAKLNHPNIVQIYDFIEAPEQLALVMELVDGRNLQTYLREHIAPLSQRLQWLTQIAEGLAIAHDAGIIHRDLKAENILINKRGNAKITDLGIAKSQDFNATLTDHVAGSYCSMSPEQAMGESISFKSDLFSLGILAYQLLCGAHPFGDTSNKLQIMQRIISHAPTPPQQHNPNLPAEFVDLLGQLLSKDPNKRPDNTHWVAAQFKKLSAMNLQDNSASDDTQALAMPHSNTNNNHITRSAGTQDHPTFETRFVAMPITTKISAWQKLKSHIAANAITLGSLAISLLIVAGVAVWQLQPKPPKYIAVIPPKLTAEGMQESQQELVKGAVYDALQQSVIQLDGYYLIPRDEIADVNGDNETIRRATGADELITAEIKCVVEACTITISRLTPEHKNPDSRLRVQNAKTVDVLTDNYLSVATIVNRNAGDLYSKKTINTLQSIDDDDYSTLIGINNTYRSTGARRELLDTLDQLHIATKETPSAQRLYREISLDIYADSNDQSVLDRLKKYLSSSINNASETSHLYNLYNLQLVEGKFDLALETTEKLSTSRSVQDELVAHVLIEKGEYEPAIKKLEKSLAIKKTAHKLFSLANAYSLIGNNSQAKKYLTETLLLSPNYYKSHELRGQIALLEGDIEQAISSFETLIKQKPHDILAINNLGLSYLLTNNYLKAFELFKTASEAAPKNNNYLINMADAKGLHDSSSEHIELYRHLIEKINNEQMNAQNLRLRSQAYAHLGKYSEALTDLQQVEKSDPDNIETIYTAALVHTLANNKASAILNIEKSLNNNMHILWFSFKWFDSLCDEPTFRLLLAQHNSLDRCHP